MFKKHWKVKGVGDKGSLEDFTFTPIFDAITEKDKDKDSVSVSNVECKEIILETPDGKEYRFDYMNLYMFFYFISSEELRQGLMKRYERKISMIPYDVSFTIDQNEKDIGKVTRRIELQVDELTMAVARQEAMSMILNQVKQGRKIDPNDFTYKKKGR